MTDVAITVQGRHARRCRPERAVVTLAAVHDGPIRADVVAAVSSTADALRWSFTALESAGSVTEWSSDNLRTSSHRPWAHDGGQLPPVIEASVDFAVTFADPDAVGAALDEAIALDGVAVHGIQWILTDERVRVELETARTRAVTDAAQKAAAYARAAGLGDIRPLAIADAGMLDGSPGSTLPTYGPELMRAATSDVPGLSFTPRDIVVEAVVDARFSATLGAS